MWLTIPMMYFEPPALCVRRFWRGLPPADRREPRTTTASSPPRTPGRCARSPPGRTATTRASRSTPRRSGSRCARAAQTAFVSYRNRVTEVNVPPPDEFPPGRPSCDARGSRLDAARRSSHRHPAAGPRTRRRPAAVGLDRDGRARLLRARGRAGRHAGGAASWASRRAPPAACSPRWPSGGMLERSRVRPLPAGPAAVRDRAARRRPADAARAVAAGARRAARAAARDRAARRARRRGRALRRPAGGQRRRARCSTPSCTGAGPATRPARAR